MKVVGCTLMGAVINNHHPFDNSIDSMQRVVALLKADEIRMAALRAVRSLGLHEGYIGAGFVRNMIWDVRHNKLVQTPLNDVDVIYYDHSELDPNHYLIHEARLQQLMPSLNWQVRNQAIMHQRNRDQPYRNILDALSHWVEKETAVAVRLNCSDELECVAAFGFDVLFNDSISHNPKCDLNSFNQRVAEKQWQVIWPKLTVIR
jgi:uncharacterized protein